jgi:C4-type Zn-finger protein
MPPARAACGTYAAYRRHLKHGENVDVKCRAAQKAHDGSRSTSASARVARAAGKTPPVPEAAVAVPEPVTETPLTGEGFVSRVEVLIEMLQESRELLKVLRKNHPERVYLQQREQREILRELSELQGNGQVKGVTLADQLAESRARRNAAAAASPASTA